MCRLDSMDDLEWTRITRAKLLLHIHKQKTARSSSPDSPLKSDEGYKK